MRLATLALLAAIGAGTSSACTWRWDEFHAADAAAPSDGGGGCPPGTVYAPDASLPGASPCIDLAHDVRHCGTLGHVCPWPGELCAPSDAGVGRCVCALGSLRDTSGECVDSNSPYSCGGVGGGTFRCRDGLECVAGQCQPAGTCASQPTLTRCGSNVFACVDLHSDVFRCGDCQQPGRCTAGQVCAQGDCRPHVPAVGCASCDGCTACPDGWACCASGPLGTVSCVQGAACP